MNNHVDYSHKMNREYFNIQPSQVKGRANLGVSYYKRVLYNKIYSAYKFTIPETWKIGYFRMFLFQFGSIAVIYTNEFGWISQPYGIVEIDINYYPKIISVSNYMLNDVKYGEIGYNAGIVHCFDDFFGFDDIVTRYAVMLAECDSSINTNLMNTKIAYLFAVKNKKDGEALKEMYGNISAGTPVVAIQRDVVDDDTIRMFDPETKKNYIAGDIANLKSSIMNMFLTEIGIKNSNTQKRERLITDEVNSNNDETQAIVSVVYDNIKTCFSRINRISGLNLDVELRYNYGQGVGGRKWDV